MNTFRILPIFSYFFLFFPIYTSCFATLERKKELESAIEPARQYISQKKNELNDKIQKESSTQKKEIWRLNVIRMEEEDWVFERIQSSLQNLTDPNGLIKLLENTNKIALSHITELNNVLNENSTYEHSFFFLRKITSYWENINFFCLRILEGFSKNGNASSTKNVEEHHQSISSFLSLKTRRHANSLLRNSIDSERNTNKIVRSNSSVAKSLKMSEIDEKRSKADEISDAIKKELFGTSDTPRKAEIGVFNSNHQERENHLPVIYAPAILAEDESFGEKSTESINEVQLLPPPIPLRKDLTNGLTIQKAPLSSKQTTNLPQIPPRKDINVNDTVKNWN